MPRLIAKERFYYAGRNVEAGEEFEAEQQDVALLTDSVSPRAKRPGESPPPESGLFERKDAQTEAGQPTEPQLGRGRYKRRDMRAKE